MQIEIKPFKVRRWHAAGVGFGLALFGSSYIPGAFPVTLMVIGGLIVFAAGANWLGENG